MGIEIGKVPSRLGINPVLNFYTSSGLWVKPSAVNFYGVFAVCVSAGGGGGSGMQGLGSTTRLGGTGGGGGARIIYFIPSNLLNASHSVTVGAGGQGGPSITTITTTGINGTNGGSSSFGENTGIFRITNVPGGGGGRSGSVASSNTGGAGGGTVQLPLYYPVQSLGGAGGRHGSGTTMFGGTDGFASGIAFGGGSFGPGGGASGRITNTQTASFTVTGGGLWLPSGFVAGGASGSGGPGLNGGNGVNYSGSSIPGLFFDFLDIPYIIGTGGGGAGSGNLAGTISAGRGGDGGFCAGGGGGGSSTNGASSGAGGNGGNGFCAIIEIYGFASSSA